MIFFWFILSTLLSFYLIFIQCVLVIYRGFKNLLYINGTTWGGKGFCERSKNVKQFDLNQSYVQEFALKYSNPELARKKEKQHSPPTNVCTVWKSRHRACCVSTSQGIQMKAPGDSTHRWTLWSFTTAPRSFCIPPVDTLRAPCEFLISLLLRWMATPYPSDTGCTHDPNWVNKVFGLQ